MRRVVFGLALAGLVGCSAADMGGPGGGADYGPEVEAGVCRDGEVVLGDGRCVPAPPAARVAVCDWRAEHDLACDDADGDCFVAGCAGVPAAVVARVADCDDTRPDVWPGAAERCDDHDNDCDGVADEDYAIGLRCDACGAEGKLECAVADPGAVACDTAPGQSSAAQGPAGTVETCDGVDDDCDGRVDEQCVLLAAAPDRGWPALCGPDHVLWVEAGQVMEARGAEGWAPTLRSAEAQEPAVAPACAGETAAWIQASPEACAAPAGAPWRCADGHLIVSTPELTYDLTGRADPGRPVVSAEAVVWHDVDGPALNAHQLGQPGLTSLFADGAALSDPTPWVDGRLAVRRWFEQGQRVVVRDPAGIEPLLNVGEEGGPPALSARWLVWSVADDAALWALDLGAPEPVGFQFTVDSGPHLRPQIHGDTVVWFAAGTLRRFDLVTGAQGVLGLGLAAPDAFAVGPEQVVWFEADGTLRRERWD